MRQFIVEAKRRGVIPVAAIYVVSIWVVLQIADILFPAWGVSPQNIRLIVYAALLGFPVVLIFGWRYDITSKGVIRTKLATVGEREQLDQSLTRRDFTTLGVLVVATIAIGGWLVTELVSERPMIPVGAPNSVAVLPFDVRGGDDAQGIPDLADHLVSTLIAIKALKVTGRESSFYFVDSTEPLDNIARLLNVRHLVTGQIVRDGSQLNVSVQLIRLPDETNIWARSFALAADRFNGILSEIGEQIAGAMRVNVLGTDRARISEVFGGSPELTNLIRLSRLKADNGNWDESLALMDQAVQRFPESVTAHVKRALAYLYSYSHTGTPSLVAVEQTAASSLNQAQALGADSAEYHLARAYEARRQIRSSGITPALEKTLEDSFEHVIAVNPSDAQAYVAYSIHFRRKREFSRAAELLETALDYDPLHPGAIWQYSRFLSVVRRHDEALEYAMRLPEYFDFGHEAVASRYWENQQLDKAIEWFRMIPDASTYNQWLLAIVWIELRAQTEAIEVLENIRGDATLTPIATSMIAAIRGDSELAYTILVPLVDETATRDPRVIMSVVNYALRSGRNEEAVRLLEHGMPGLKDATAPFVDEAGAMGALNLAYALTQIPGNEIRAGILSSQVLNGIRGRPRIGFDGIGIRDALVYAYQGDTTRAISAIRDAYEAGWRGLYDDIGMMPLPLQSLAGNSDFDQIVAAINHDLGEMRERARGY